MKTRQTEQELQIQVMQYIRLRYPDVIAHSDTGSGMKLTKFQAIQQKRLQAGRRAYPDIFIARAKLSVKEGEEYGIDEIMSLHYNGLFIELKREGVKILKKDGTLVANEHIREQFDMLEDLRREGYMAEFACGFDEAKKIIDDYLG